jgi:uncharacterized phage-associated protein
MARNVFDVAKYILEKTGVISTWKLQKLVYYSQAWNLVWNDAPLFPEEIQAWANGPVCPTLYNARRGYFTVGQENIRGDSTEISADEKKTIDKIVDFYGKFDGQQLSDITHSEIPWQRAREGLGVMERGKNPMSLETMAEFYSSLPRK